MFDVHAQYLRETQAWRQLRGSFGHAYATPKNPKALRLMELAEFVFKPGQDGSLDPVEGSSRFSVVDTVTLEKAIFEWPSGVSAESVHVKIESHFGARAHRVGAAFWIV